jgi:hypothetical protein
MKFALDAAVCSEAAVESALAQLCGATRPRDQSERAYGLS